MKQHLYIVALVLGACAVDEPEGVATQPLGTSCDPIVCPGNSDILAALGPFELDQTGAQVSKRGFRIVGLDHSFLDVVKLGIFGTEIQMGTGAGDTLGGPTAVGLKLTLKHTPRYGEPAHYDLHVDGYTAVPYYAGGGWFWGYHVSYGQPGAEVLKELCPYVEHVDHGVNGSWAVFWKGDRYQPETGKIFASGDATGDWFNISCAGEATIKMLRARTGGAVVAASPVDQRQATLNMFTASYCGANGQRFTQLGQALAWSDLSGPSEMGQALHEAVWDENGARCLDVPRWAKYDFEDIQCTNAKVMVPCTQDDLDSWQDLGWLRSGTPAP